MPVIWERDTTKLGVYVDELVPLWWPTWDALRQLLCRAKKRGYGPMYLQNGGGLGNEVLIDYDTLDRDIQASITDLRRDENFHYMEKFYVEDAETKDFYTSYRHDESDPTSTLNGAERDKYITHASVLKAVKAFWDEHVAHLTGKKKRAKGKYDWMAKEAQAFKPALKRIAGKTHDLPETGRNFRVPFDRFFSSEGIYYAGIIHGNKGNKAAKKTPDTVQEALLKKLLRHANNLNYEQVRKMYNEVAEISDWKSLSRKSVENFAKAHKLEITGGRRGENEFDNTMAMQHKRRPIAYPMLMWSVDGWDVELLYQKTELNAKGHSVTTYHNRPTVVVVLDPYSEYPMGYAIGTHETPQLIRQAVRNAFNHTAELYTCRHRPQQLQSDRYGGKELKAFYEAASAKAFTPAKVKNAKAKYVERYFDHLNESYCQYLNNWSGHNVTSRKENQPNTEWKNKIRHSFPDYDGVVMQIEMAIMSERNKKRAELMEGWAKLPEMYKAPINTENYLLTLGELKERSSRFRGNGLVFDIAGREFSYDSFDIAFRRYSHIDWQVRYDLEDMETVLATSKDETVRFLLNEKFAEGATIAERQSSDYEYGAKVDQFNKNMKQQLMLEAAQEHDDVEDLLIAPEYKDTLSKMLIVDSMGQHKDRRNAQKIAAPKTKEIKEAPDTSLAERRQAYINSKVNLNDYL